MIHTKKPEHFTPKFEVVSCFLQYEDEILLLLRQDHKNEGNTYWVPAGKVWPEEHINEAIQREIAEETSLDLERISYFKKLYVQYPTYDFVYHIYYKKLENKPIIIINPEEHKKYIWRTPEQALKEPLIQDLDACIKMFYQI